MKIHAIQTGSITIKESYYNAKGKTRIARLTSVLLDRKLRDVPVYTWAIEHPEGLIVIDTGMSAEMGNYSYFPLFQQPYWRSQYRFHITPQEEIGPQLKARGLAPEDVRWLVMTHSHFDHSGGLHHFPNSDVIFTRKDYHDTMMFRSARFAFPSQWPAWLASKVKQIEFNENQPAFGPFAQSYRLTQAGDVYLVPTPGHAMGHLSVVLNDEGYTYFFAGDASFDLPSLLNGTLDAPAFNSDVTLATRRKILALAADTPLVYLSTHDPQTAARLARRETVYGSMKNYSPPPNGRKASMETQSPSTRTPVTR